MICMQVVQITGFFLSWLMAFKSSMAHRMINSVEKRENKKSNNSTNDDEQQVSDLISCIKNTQNVIKQINDIVPKFQNAQQTHHRLMNIFIEQLKSTHLSTAQLDNPFSNPEDPFAELCRSIGFEMNKFELIEKDYLQKLNSDFIYPIKQFKDTQFKNIYTLQSKYKRLEKKYSKNKKQQQSDE
eukprot:357164_1